MLFILKYYLQQACLIVCLKKNVSSGMHDLGL